MPLMQVKEIDGVKVLEIVFKDTKAEQEFMAVFQKTQAAGLALVHQWLPGVQNDNRADPNRCVSRLRVWTAPVIGGKAAATLPESDPLKPEVGKAVAKAESVTFEPILEAMSEQALVAIAPRIGAKINPRWPKAQMLAAMSIAIAKNPKNWADISAQLKAKAEAMAPVASAGPITA